MTKDICKCCNVEADSQDTSPDQALQGSVCGECREDLLNAQGALNSQNIKGIYRGDCADNAIPI